MDGLNILNKDTLAVDRKSDLTPREKLAAGSTNIIDHSPKMFVPDSKIIAAQVDKAIIELVSKTWLDYNRRIRQAKKQARIQQFKEISLSFSKRGKRFYRNAKINLEVFREAPADYVHDYRKQITASLRNSRLLRKIL